MKASAKKAKAPPPSLHEFMQAKARALCAVCKLPESVQAQLGASSTKRGFTRDDQLEWLHAAVGAAHVTREMLAAHLNGRHFHADEVTAL